MSGDNDANSESDPWFYNVTDGRSCRHEEETLGAAEEDPKLLTGCTYTLYIYVINKVDAPNANTNSYLSKARQILKTIAFWLLDFMGCSYMIIC